jgi:hypothetical protein
MVLTIMLMAGTLLASATVALADDASPSPLLPSGPVEVVIAGADEPGTPLRIEGRVIDAASWAPVPDAAIVVYQADAGGEYEPADVSDESTARLRGELTTYADGRFALRTILPGEYPDQPPGNRHVHVHSVSAEGYEPRGFVILFEANVRDEVRTWAESTGFGEIIELTEDEGVLDGSLKIMLEPVSDGASPTP